MPSQQAARQPFAVKFNVKTNRPRRPDVMKNLGRNNTDESGIQNKLFAYRFCNFMAKSALQDVNLGPYSSFG